jgi:hypothetical protein
MLNNYAVVAFSGSAALYGMAYYIQAIKTKDWFRLHSDYVVILLN